jgi:beta-lactamase regulating signal transducer with metallopeptidase domain
MIAAWMMYTVVVTFLLFTAALAAEHVTRALRVPARFAWLFAMTAAVALSGRALLHGKDAPRQAPLASGGTPSLRVDPSASNIEGGAKAGSATGVSIAVRRPSAGSARIETSLARLSAVERALVASASRIDMSALDRWNRTLIVAWIASSALVASWLLISFLRLARLAGRLARQTVGDHSVLVSEDVGPALLGILRTRIVLPRWVLELPPAERDIIVAHEREHAAAYDPALICATMCLVALEPWNVVLWVLLSRMRLAVEADCDQRVLGETGDARAYGQLLVAMYERTSGVSPHVAFAERASNLERRIRRITSRPRLVSTAVGASAIAVTLFATAAWKTPAPARTFPRSTPPFTSDSITKPVAAEAAPAEPELTVRRSSMPSESLTVTFRQIVIAASDSSDIARVARLADSVADLLRRRVPFDTLAKQFHDYAGREMTSVTTPWPVDSLPPSYQKGLAGARLGDIVLFQIPGSPQRRRVPKFVVAQVLSIQPRDVHQAPEPRSALAEPPFAAVRAETSVIHVTIESANQAEYRLVVPQDSTTRPIRVIRGRAEFIWGTYPPSSMMEITSIDTTSQVHVEAAQNGRVIASGEGAYLVLRRDSVGARIEAWSHVPPSRSQVLPKPSGTATSNEQSGGAATGPCASPDSIAIRGLSRIPDADARSDLGITPKSTINGALVTQSLKNLYATNNFEANGTATCEIIGGKSVLVFNVTERRRDADLLQLRLGSAAPTLVELELQRVSSATDSASVRRLDSEIATLHDRLRSSPGGVEADREATTRVLLALEARASIVRERLVQLRAVYTDEYPLVRNARDEDRAIGERLSEIRRGM